MDKQVKISRIYETTFEDGSFWIEYEAKGLVGFEMSKAVDYHTDKDTLEEAINNNPNLVKKFCDKILLNSVTNELLKDIVMIALQSDNEMAYIDYEEMEESLITEDDLKKLQDYVYKIGITEDITIHDGEYAVCAYGGIITDFLF